MACSHTALSASPARTREIGSSEDVHTSSIPSCAGPGSTSGSASAPPGKRRLTGSAVSAPDPGGHVRDGHALGDRGAGPGGQLGDVPLVAALHRVGALGEPVQARAGQLAGDREHLSAPDAAGRRQAVEALGGHRPRGQPPPVGTSLHDRAQQVRGVARAARRPQQHARDVPLVAGVGQPAHPGRPAQPGRRHLQVVQRGPAAEHQVATGRVGVDELAPEVGEQVDLAARHPPGPGLGVVHAGRPARELEDLVDLGRGGRQQGS